MRELQRQQEEEMARQMAAAAQAAAEAEALRARQEVRVPPLLSKQMSCFMHCAPRTVQFVLHQCALFEPGTLLAFVHVDACGSHCCVHFDPVVLPMSHAHSHCHSGRHRGGHAPTAGGRGGRAAAARSSGRGPSQGAGGGGTPC